MVRHSRLFCYLVSLQIGLLQPPSRASTKQVWAFPISLSATNGITIVFSSSPYWDVSVQMVTPKRVNIRHKWCILAPWCLVKDGFPHSDTDGSQLFGSSPTTFAALRVLLRQLTPRHPPTAWVDLFYDPSIFSFALPVKMIWRKRQRQNSLHFSKYSKRTLPGVDRGRVELPTFRMQTERSGQLS